MRIKKLPSPAPPPAPQGEFPATEFRDCSFAPSEGTLVAFMHMGRVDPEQPAFPEVPENDVEPEAAKVKFENAVWVEGGRLNQYWQYFIAKGVNPFRQSRHEIERALRHFEDEIDSQASQKGITVS